jgi:hypothetical protein
MSSLPHVDSALRWVPGISGASTIVGEDLRCLRHAELDFADALSQFPWH